MRNDVDHSHFEELSIDAPGADEVAVVPWPLLLRERVVEKMADSPRYPWVVLAVALFGLFSVGFTITILSVSIPRSRTSPIKDGRSRLPRASRFGKSLRNLSSLC